MQINCSLFILAFLSALLNVNDLINVCLCLVDYVIPAQALQEYKNEVRGKQRLGVQAFADAMLIIPKCLAQNGGHDAQECLVKLLQEYKGLTRPVRL